MLKGLDLINDIDACDPDCKLAFWWLGQLGFCFKSAGHIFYADPFLSVGSTSSPRLIPPLCAPAQIHNADYIIGTHDHTDHIDRTIWPALAQASPQAKFVVSSRLVHLLSNELSIPLERFIGLRDEETIQDGDVSFTGVAAAHEFFDQDPVTGEYPYMGVGIRTRSASVFHSGDTLVYDGMAEKLHRLGDLDLMVLPINGRDAERYIRGCIGNMTYQEAVDLAGTVRPKLVVPGHYDMFADNGENPYRFAAYLEAKYPQQAFWTGGHGIRVTL